MSPSSTSLDITVNAGPRALIADWEIRGTSPLDPAKTLARLGLIKGEPYRDRVLSARLSEIRDELRSKHFYTAVAQNLQPTVSADGTQVSLVIVINAGPLVEWHVTGKLPGSEDDFIPIKRQNSVDRDLLADARDDIVEEFKRQGYFRPRAEYVITQPTPESPKLVVNFTVDGGKRYRIIGLDLPSDLRGPRAEFQAQKDLAIGAVFNEEGVTAALDAVARKFQDLGFHRVVMKPEFEEVPGKTADEGGIVIHPKITEGPRATVSSITFDLGERPIVTKQELADAMKSKEHAPYALGNLQQDRIDVPLFYESRGFLNRLVTIAPVINATGTEVRLDVFAREGPQVFVGEIVVLGNDKVKTEVILGELTLRTGEPYSEQARLNSQRALNGLPSLKSSRIVADDRLPGEATVRLVISVEESSSTTVDPGAGVEVGSHPRAVEGGGVEDRIEFAPRFSLGVGRRNLGGRDRAINLFGRVSLKPKNAPGDPELDGQGFGFIEYRVAAAYSERHAFNSATNVLLTVSSEQAIRTSFNFVRRLGTADFVRPLPKKVSLLGRYTLEWTRLFDEIIQPQDQPLIDRLFPQVRLSIVSGGILWDRRKTVAGLQNGEQVIANLDVALRQLGSEVGFVKSFMQGSIYRPIPGSRRLVFAGRAQLGLARGFAHNIILVDDDGNPVLDPNGDPVEVFVADLPASQRFFAGGSTSVRGFQLDRLGVREILNEDGLSNGGNGMIIFNAEVRAQVGKLFKRDLVIVGFVDTGNVFRRVSDLDLGRLRTAVGFGARYDSPLGPIRLDVGFKTDQMFFLKSTERRWELHFSLGEVF
jgi:outer membrane protein assembly factor BamA